MTAQDPVVIVSIARTPMGGLLGDFASVPATALGAAAIKAAVSRAGLSNDNVDEVLMGCVLPAGLGQAPARQAALGAGLAQSVACSTVNKVCGSGMKTVMLAHDQIMLGNSNVIVAGGMESMSRAPHMLPDGRTGTKFGDITLRDHMMYDGLRDAYSTKIMGVHAEDCAKHYQFTRQSQDEFAISSLTRAQKAINDGAFAAEITPVSVKAGKEVKEITIDEQPGKARPDKIPTLKPAFAEDGTITAANASSISDGAAALVLMRRSEAQKRGLKILATIAGHTSHSQAPEWFTTAPVGALKKLSEKTGWAFNDVDLFEVNEAFAVVTMAAMKELGLPHDKVNVHGGACALGHPLGASGARILVTLIAALEKYSLKRGMATLCIGGGEAVAVAIERAA
jgi:acetyl-CoA C-acetyltransferase